MRACVCVCVCVCARVLFVVVVVLKGTRDLGSYLLFFGGGGLGGGVESYMIVPRELSLKTQIFRLQL